MAFPLQNLPTYGGWTQVSEGNADLETRFNGRGINIADAPYNAVLDGIADDTAAFNTAHATLVAQGGGKLISPGGILRTTSALILDLSAAPIFVEWEGNGTTIKPSSALNGLNVLKLGSTSTDPHVRPRFKMRGFNVDGINTKGSVGILVGENAANLSTYMRFDDIDVYNFGGVGGKAWHIKNQVSALLVHCYGSRSTQNLNIGHAAAPSLPTTIRFIESHFRDGLGQGVVIEQVNGAAFLWSIIEGNALEGVSAVTRTSTSNILDVDFNECYFETNYNVDSTKYHILVNGSAGGTVSVRQRGCRFAGRARAAYYRSAYNLVVDSPSTPNVANQIVVDVGCDGWFTNEQSNNSPYRTIVTNSSPTFRFLAAELDAMAVLLKKTECA